MDIILASESPRRKFLLETINLAFKISKPDIDEKNVKINHNKPSEYCKKLSEKKCLNVASKFKKSLIIAADTIVYNKKNIYNKPNNRNEAVKYLKSLSNQTHIVYTGVSLMIKSKNIKINFYDKTYVTFYEISNQSIHYYVDNYKPYDKAGSYGIQDWSMIFVKKLNGCFNNVVGFPVSKFYKLASRHSTLNKIIQSNQKK